MRRLLPLTLRGQLVLVIFATFAVVQAVNLLLYADERQLAVRSALGEEAAGRAANVVRLLEATDPALHEDILRAASSPLVRFSVNNVAMVDHLDHGDTGDVAARIRALLNDANAHEIRVELHRLSSPANGAGTIPSSMAQMHEEMMGLTLTPVEMQLAIALNTGGWLNVSSRFHRPPLQWPWISSLSYGAAALLIMAVVWFALSQLTGPLRTLARAAEGLGRGETTEALPEQGPEELRRLTTAFNQMQARLLRFIAERTRLLAALGHDLRSPLTALRVRAEMVDDEETRTRLISIIEEMMEMVNSTLSFARGMAASEPSQTVDIASFLGELTADIALSGGKVSLKAAHGLKVRIRPVALRRALRNLLENAIRYGGRADVAVAQDGSNLHIRICDNGPGIPEADLERVFDPFVRVEKSRSLETGGTGLGLSIARTIIHAHGGEITLSNQPQGGLCADLTLPVISATTVA